MSGTASGIALVIGETLIDEIWEHGAISARHPGGAAANVAIGLVRQGHRVTLATHIGPDADGALLAAPLTAAGVHLQTLHTDPLQPSFIARATLDQHGAASYDFDLEWSIRPPTLAPTPTMVHTGCLAATLLPGADTVLAYLDEARATSFISYDVNLRPAAVTDFRDMAARVEAFVEVSNLIKASDEDLAWLHPTEDPARVAAHWATDGRTVVLTRGADGATAFENGHETHVPSFAVPVADTIGAGDAFCAGLLAALWRTGRLRAFRAGNLPLVDETALRYAAASAAITVSRAGANPPSEAEVCSFLAQSPAELPSPQ